MGPPKWVLVLRFHIICECKIMRIEAESIQEINLYNMIGQDVSENIVLKMRVVK